MVSSMVVPSPGAENTFNRPPTSNARSRMPDTPRRPPDLDLRCKAAAVVTHPQGGAADAGELDADGGSARVLDDVGQRLLRDAVEHELLLVGQLGRVAVPVEGGADAGALAEVRHLGGERGDEAVVVEGRGAEGARERQQLLHRLGRERLDLLELGAQPGRDVERGGLEPEQDRGQGLVDLVVQVLGDAGALLLLGADDGAAALDALLLDAGEHLVEAGGQALDLVRRARGGVGALAGRARVDALHRRQQRLERHEPALEQQGVDEHGADDGDADEQRPANVVRVQQRRDQRGDRDERRVDGEDLVQEGTSAHCPVLIGRSRLRVVTPCRARGAILFEALNPDPNSRGRA